MEMMNNFDKYKKQLERLSNRKERDIAKRYADLYREVYRLIRKQYDKFEVDGELTYTEMAKYDRLNKLLKDINIIINQSATGLRSEIKGHLRNQYQESYYQTSFLIESKYKAKIGYSRIKKEVLDEVISNDLTGLTLNERLSRHRRDLVYNIRGSLIRGLREGQTYRQMTNAIKEELEGDRKKAQAIVRTESKRVREAGSLESVREAERKGVKMTKTWNTVQDERVRDRHESLDGVTIDADELFKINGYAAEAPTQFGVAEMDINCRCYLSYEVVEVNKPEHEELEDLTYLEWQKERLR